MDGTIGYLSAKSYKKLVLQISSKVTYWQLHKIDFPHFFRYITNVFQMCIFQIFFKSFTNVFKHQVSVQVLPVRSKVKCKMSKVNVNTHASALPTWSEIITGRRDIFQDFSFHVLQLEIMDQLLILNEVHRHFDL